MAESLKEEPLTSSSESHSPCEEAESEIQESEGADTYTEAADGSRLQVKTRTASTARKGKDSGYASTRDSSDPCRQSQT